MVKLGGEATSIEQGPKSTACLLHDAKLASDVLVLKLILVLVFILLSSQHFYFIHF